MKFNQEECQAIIINYLINELKIPKENIGVIKFYDEVYLDKLFCDVFVKTEQGSPYRVNAK
jgi:hypothetical protein